MYVHAANLLLDIGMLGFQKLTRLENSVGFSYVDYKIQLISSCVQLEFEENRPIKYALITVRELEL